MVVANGLNELREQIIKKVKKDKIKLKDIRDKSGVSLNTIYIFLHRDANISIYNLEALCNSLGIEMWFKVE